MPVPNQLPTRTLKGAIVAAEKRGSTTVELRLRDSTTVTFVIAEVMDDALLGNRLGSDRAGIIPMSAILIMEFTA